MLRILSLFHGTHTHTHRCACKQLTHAHALLHIDIQMGQPNKFTEPLFERIKSVSQTLKWEIKGVRGRRDEARGSVTKSPGFNWIYIWSDWIQPHCHMHFTCIQGKYFSSCYPNLNWVIFNPTEKTSLVVYSFLNLQISNYSSTGIGCYFFRMILIRNSN